MAEETGAETAQAPEGSVVRLYTKRLWWTPAAFLGVLFVIGGLAMMRSTVVCGIRGCVPGPLAGTLCILLGAPLALFGLYYVLTPIPLLCLDQDSMLYQTSPLRVVRVRWEDVQFIRASSQININPNRHRRSRQFDITIALTSRAVTDTGGRSILSWHFSGANLPLPPQQIVEMIRRYRPVQYLDRGEQDITKFGPLNRHDKPSRQARWAARHPGETRH